ncbi:hypothetical protein LTR64_002682 [Lithohypha guttulata]|uniref:uncharacterized protein n=1 Tax=Lithohypha guttulata TaxID=1690604 RepID=UPI002DE026BA|nr:hypothetical protein LTR51_001094 [Lithohypha guttulata]
MNADYDALADSNINQTHSSASRQHESSGDKRTKLQQSRPICRYFVTGKGCRAGNQCRFQHIKPVEPSSLIEKGNSTDAEPHALSHTNPRALSATTVSSARLERANVSRAPVSRPVAQAELDDPREYQITQVVRRHKPFRADLGDETTLKFRLSPTDPDFPFELENGLQCVLRVPSTYPRNGKPTLAVQNPEMARGFQINVEQGFNSLVSQHPGKSLLALLNELDKSLERFLTSTKANTVKLISNRPKEVPVVPEKEHVKPAPVDVPAVLRYDVAQLREAKTRREAEIRQLEARLGRSDLFSKVGDGIAFNVPLQNISHSVLPASLQAVRDTALIVPEVYPLEPCTIILKGVHGEEAEHVEIAFEQRVVEKPELSLMAHINYLTQNLGKMAKVPSSTSTQVRDVGVDHDYSNEIMPSSTSQQQTANETIDPARPHLRYMARPPEWQQPNKGNVPDEVDSSESSEYDSEEDSEHEIEDSIEGMVLPTAIEKGIQISLPRLDMTGIELLQISKLSIAVKCNRCKEQAEFKDLTPATNASGVTQRSLTCQKCSAVLSATYHFELMHVNSSRAGHIEVENCSISDLLPSLFQPTCAQCSTTYPSPPGVVAVAGDSKLTNCRSCHSKMTFSIPEVKFLNVSTTVSKTTLPLRSTKPKERLGISAGTPLPDNGKCQHYAKSYRWFRFSCCNRVFPCDKCHDSATTNPAQKDNPHSNEHADRMICGWCSREQRYHPDTCRMCGHSVVKKHVTTGFWEGGKGTREKHLMRRKEGRKYKVSGREKKELESVKKSKENKGKGGMWWPG